VEGTLVELDLFPCTNFGTIGRINGSDNKTAAAICQYQADCNGELGEIQFDFENSGNHSSRQNVIG
jgi:hypothetical protein